VEHRHETSSQTIFPPGRRCCRAAERPLRKGARLSVAPSASTVASHVDIAALIKRPGCNALRHPTRCRPDALIINSVSKADIARCLKRASFNRHAVQQNHHSSMASDGWEALRVRQVYLINKLAAPAFSSYPASAIPQENCPRFPS
jgi:hypothetical protein